MSTDLKTVTEDAKPPSLPFTILPIEILARRDLSDAGKVCVGAMFYFLVRKGDIKGDLSAYVQLATGRSYGKSVDLIRYCERMGYTLKSIRSRYHITLGIPKTEDES